MYLNLRVMLCHGERIMGHEVLLIYNQHLHGLEDQVPQTYLWNDQQSVGEGLHPQLSPSLHAPLVLHQRLCHHHLERAGTGHHTACKTQREEKQEDQRPGHFTADDCMPT